LGAVGIGLGFAASSLEIVQTWRGEWAAWALIAFGLVYFTWGLRRAHKNHRHSHANTSFFGYGVSPLVLLTIYIVGACESLIPLLMYPAAQESFSGMVMVTSVFSLVTLTTMSAAVLISSYGLNWLRLPDFDRYAHAISGGAVTLCGCSIIMLGL